MEPGNIISGEGDDGLNGIFERTISHSDRAEDSNKPENDDRRVSMKDEIERMVEELELKIPEKEVVVKKAHEQRERLREDVKECVKMCDFKKKVVIELLQNLLLEHEEWGEYEKQKCENQVKLDKQNELVAQEEKDLEILREQKRKVSRMEAVRIKQEQFAETNDRHERKISDLENELKEANREMEKYKNAYGQAVRDLTKSVDERDNIDNNIICGMPTAITREEEVPAVTEEVIVTTTMQSPNSYPSQEDLHLQQSVVFPQDSGRLETDGSASDIPSSQADTLAQSPTHQTTGSEDVTMEEDYHISPETVGQENSVLQEKSFISEVIASPTTTDISSPISIPSPEDSSLNNDKDDFSEAQSQACEIPLQTRQDEGNDQEVSINVGNVDATGSGHDGPVSPEQSGQAMISPNVTGEQTLEQTSPIVDKDSASTSRAGPMKFKCDFCEKHFLFSFGVKRHLMKCHPESDQEAICDPSPPASTLSSPFQEMEPSMVPNGMEKITDSPISDSAPENKTSSDELSTVIGTATATTSEIQHGLDVSLSDTNSKKFICLCKKQFSGKENLTFHINVLTKEWKFQCEECDERRYSVYLLKVHYKKAHDMPTALQEMKIGCTQCGAMFPTKEERNKHMRSHKLNESTQKAEMEKTSDTTNYSSLRLHLRRSHKKPQGKSSPCCQFPLKSQKQSSKIRIKTRKTLPKMRTPASMKRKSCSEQQKRFSCPKCPSKFESVELLKEHGSVAHKMNFKLEGCCECGALFPSIEMLAAHQISHKKMTVNLSSQSSSKSPRITTPGGTTPRKSKTTNGSESSSPAKKMRKSMLNESGNFWDFNQMTNKTYNLGQILP